MFAESKHAFGRLRGQTIGWGIGLFLYGLIMAVIFDSMTSLEGMQEMLEQYPPELAAFLGGDLSLSTTPIGYSDSYYFSYITLIAGIFSIGVGGSLISGDEEKGILDLVMTMPISRNALFWGRLLAVTVATAIIMVISWLGWAIPSGSTTMNLSWLELLWPFISLYAVLMLLTTLALLLSMLLPSGRAAGLLAGALLVGNFLQIGLAQLNDNLESIVKFTPLNFYQGGKAIEGINLAWLAGLFGGAIILAMLAWWRFRLRDIRVGGERSWRLPKLARLTGRG
jgi:ABC-2 type transport system permease protein